MTTDTDRQARRTLLDTLAPYRWFKGDAGDGRTITAGVPTEVVEEILPLLPGAVRTGAAITLRPADDEIVVIVQRSYSETTA